MLLRRRYEARLDASQVRSWQQVLENVSSQQEQVVDARPEPRWGPAAAFCGKSLCHDAIGLLPSRICLS